MGREEAMPTIWAELKWREMKIPLPILQVSNVHGWSRLMLNLKGTVVGTTCMNKAWSGARRVTRGPWQRLSITIWNTVFTRSRETLNMLPLGKQFSELVLRDFKRFSLCKLSCFWKGWMCVARDFPTDQQAPGRWRKHIFTPTLIGTWEGTRPRGAQYTLHYFAWLRSQNPPESTVPKLCLLAGPHTPCFGKCEAMN